MAKAKKDFEIGFTVRDLRDPRLGLGIITNILHGPVGPVYVVRFDKDAPREPSTLYQGTSHLALTTKEPQ
jgi:hypothetical protein